MKKLMIGLLGVSLAAAVCAADKTAHWVNNSSAGRQWETAASWLTDDGEQIVPGRYGTDGTQGETGWTAVFDRSADWLIRMNKAPYSISNVVIKAGTGVSGFGQGNFDYIYLEPGGMFCVDSSSTRATFTSTAHIGMRDMLPSSRITIRNDSRETVLKMNSFTSFVKAPGMTTFCYPTVLIAGCGFTELTGSLPNPSGFRTYLSLAQDEGGVLRIPADTTVANVLTLQTEESLPKQHFEIMSGATLKTDVIASPSVEANSDLEISGEGTFAAHSSDNQGLIVIGARLDVLCNLTVANDASSVNNCLVIRGGDGGVVFLGHEENAFTQAPRVSSVTLEVPGLADAGVVSPIGAGTRILLSRDGKFKYTGPAVSCDRAIELVDGYGTMKLEQAGTGPLVLSGDVTTTAFQTILELANDTDQPATLSGAILKGTYRPDMLKTGSGEWILNGANTTDGIYTLKGGTLTAGTAQACKRVAVDGGTEQVVLKVADGVELPLTSLTWTSGALDIRTGVGASVRVANLARGAAPLWLTINGSPAWIASDGTVKPLSGLLLMFY